MSQRRCLTISSCLFLSKSSQSDASKSQVCHNGTFLIDPLYTGTLKLILALGWLEERLLEVEVLFAIGRRAQSEPRILEQRLKGSLCRERERYIELRSIAFWSDRQKGRSPAFDKK